MKNVSDPDSGRRGLKNILVPTDFSASSDTALHVAIDLARQQNARIYLLHVTSSWQNSEMVSVQNQIAGFAEARSVDVVPEIRSGEIYEQIMKILPEKSIDLIAIPVNFGSGSLFSRFRKLTARIKRNAPCSVLVVGV